MKNRIVGMLNDMGMEAKLKLSSEDLKEVKDWKVGNSYTLQVQVTMTEAELEGDDCVCAEFSIEKIKIV